MPIRRSAMLASAWCLLVAPVAHAAPGVSLKAAVTPDRPGASTTIHIGFEVAYPDGEPPLPATEIQFFLPKGLGIANSELGLANCLPAQLELEGAVACPPNSLMGHGQAVTAVPFGSHFVVERTTMALFSGPLREGHPQLLFVARGEYPVIAEVIFGGLVLPADARYGGLIETQLPLVPSVPNGPDVALLGLQTTIGPAGITYHERVNGKIVSFHPKGIRLPPGCPHGGFPFAVHLSFQDGSVAAARTAVPCPRGQPAGSRRGS